MSSSMIDSCWQRNKDFISCENCRLYGSAEAGVLTLEPTPLSVEDRLVLAANSEDACCGETSSGGGRIGREVGAVWKDSSSSSTCSSSSSSDSYSISKYFSYSQAEGMSTRDRDRRLLDYLAINFKLTINEAGKAEEVESRGTLFRFPPEHLVEQISHIFVQLELRDRDKFLDISICVVSNLRREGEGRKGQVNILAVIEITHEQ